MQETTAFSYLTKKSYFSPPARKVFFFVSPLTKMDWELDFLLTVPPLQNHTQKTNDRTAASETQGGGGGSGPAAHSARARLPHHHGSRSRETFPPSKSRFSTLWCGLSCDSATRLDHNTLEIAVFQEVKALQFASTKRHQYLMIKGFP